MPCCEHNNTLKFNNYLAPLKICFGQEIEVVVAEILGAARDIPRTCVKLNHLLTDRYFYLTFLSS